MRSLALVLCLCVAAFAGEIEDEIAALGDFDVERRERAAGRLIEIGEPALPALRHAALEHEDAEIQSRAGSIVNVLEWKQVLPASFRAAHPELPGAIIEGDEALRIRWLRALSRECPREAVPGTLRFLRAGPVRVRLEALSVLSGIGEGLPEHREPADLEVVFPLLNDPDRNTRALALKVAGLWGRSVGKKDALAQAVRRRVYPAALEGLESPHESVRTASAFALGLLGERGARRILEATTQDELAGVREAATRALGELGDAEAEGALLARLGDGNLAVVRAALGSCRKLGLTRATPEVKRILGDGAMTPLVRQAALEVLVVLAPPALEEARGLTGHEHAGLRAAAWRVVLDVEPARGGEAAKDEEAEVRLVVARALARAEAAVAVPVLLVLARDDRAATVRDGFGNDLLKSDIREEALRSLAAVTGHTVAETDPEKAADAWDAWWKSSRK